MPERMFLSLFARRALVCGCLAIAAPAVVFSQTNYIRTGVEYAIAGSLPQDQGQPQLGLSTSGGYLVWQDTITDGDGLGISALRLDNGFSGVLSSFRVNSIGAGDQENPQVSLLPGGGGNKAAEASGVAGRIRRLGESAGCNASER